MPDEVTPATPQPGAKAESSGEKQSAGNVSMAEAAALLFKQKPEAKTVTADQVTPEPSDEEPQPEGTPTAAEEQQNTSAEAETEATDEAEQPSAETETEAAADDDLSKSTQLDAKTQERINRRIGKEVAKRKALEGTLNELRAEMAELRQSRQQPEAVQPTTPHPGAVTLAEINDVPSLQQRLQQADAAIEYCDRVLDHIEDGGQPPDGWTKQALKEAKRNAEREKTRDIPARYQFLDARHKSQQQAFKQFPFLADKKSNEYLLAQQLRQHHPWLQTDIRGDIALGVLVRGIKAIQEEADAAKKKADATKPKVVTSAKPSSDQTAVGSATTTTGRAPAAGQKQAIAKATAELKAKGNVSGSDAAKFLLQKQLARNAR